MTPLACRAANRGGRLRWKIENEGFKIQKNGGPALELAPSTRPGAIQNWYLLLQIARLILQLLERGNLLGQAAPRLFGSFRNLGQRLAESVRDQVIPVAVLQPHACRAVQLRLNRA